MTLLGIHSEKNMTRKDTGIPMFTAALFKLAKHPSIEEWIKMWAMNTGVGSLPILQGVFLTQELNKGVLHCKQILYQLSYQGSCRESLFCSNKLRQSLAHLVSICTFITYCMCLRNHLLVRNKNTFKTVL